jgi:positive regulator of sigma E activity
VKRWISRQGNVVLQGGVPVVEFRGECPGAASHCGTCAGSSVRRIPAKLLGLAPGGPPGSAVTLRVDATSLNRVASVCFALPLVVLLAGAWVGRWLGTRSGFDAELLSATLGLSLLVLALAALVRWGGAVLRLLDLRARRWDAPAER